MLVCRRRGSEGLPLSKTATWCAGTTSACSKRWASHSRISMTGKLACHVELSASSHPGWLAVSKAWAH